MELLKEKLKNNEWVISYIWADWCKACDTNKSIIDEVIKENYDISFIKINAMDKDYASILKDIDFESLPYYAVWHSKKENINLDDPTTAFVGGETGIGKEVPTQIVTMIRQFNAQNVLK